MTPRLLVASFAFALPAFAGEAPSAPSPREILHAQLAEQAKNAPATPSPGSPAGAAATVPAQTPAQPSAAETNPLLASKPAPAATTATPTPTTKKTPKEPATVMPKVEVRKGRVTELDKQLAKQEQDIAREKKNTKPTETDKLLNDSKIAKPLAIFGGESTQFRQHVANERVSLMEDEKDLIEAIAHARTKEEKAELKKQLEFLRMQRRELERSLR